MNQLLALRHNKIEPSNARAARKLLDLPVPWAGGEMYKNLHPIPLPVNRRTFIAPVIREL